MVRLSQPRFSSRLFLQRHFQIRVLLVTNQGWPRVVNFSNSCLGQCIRATTPSDHSGVARSQRSYLETPLLRTLSSVHGIQTRSVVYVLEHPSVAGVDVPDAPLNPSSHPATVERKLYW